MESLQNKDWDRYDIPLPRILLLVRCSKTKLALLSKNGVTVKKYTYKNTAATNRRGFILDTNKSSLTANDSCVSIDRSTNSDRGKRALRVLSPRSC
jgi:hypothetical protein